MNDRFAEFKAIIDGRISIELPSIWKHEPGKPLMGTIKGFSSFHHNRYGQQETVIIELESGELVSAILTPYLRHGMKEQNAEVNDLILIQYFGKERSSNGNSFNKFNLVIRKEYRS